MRCFFPSKCNEPYGLCCNFCSNQKCDVRCKDDYKKCKLYDKDGKIIIESGVRYHLLNIDKSKIIKHNSEIPVKSENNGKNLTVNKSVTTENSSKQSMNNTVNKLKSTLISKSKVKKSGTEKVSLF